jgi:hypothetical protein
LKNAQRIINDAKITDICSSEVESVTKPKPFLNQTPM